MKRALLIVGFVALGAALIFGGMVWYILTRTEEDKNRKKTESARKARWEKREEENFPMTQRTLDELDKELSDLHPSQENGVEQKQNQE